MRGAGEGPLCGSAEGLGSPLSTKLIEAILAPRILQFGERIGPWAMDQRGALFPPLATSRTRKKHSHLLVPSSSAIQMGPALLTSGEEGKQLGIWNQQETPNLSVLL